MARFEYVKTRREDVQKIPVKYEKLVRLGAKLYTKLNVPVYKMSGGRLMNKGPADKPICLVTMTGRKSGKKREIPLMHVPHGEQKILVASLGGISKNPVWYYNLKATPDITITADPCLSRSRVQSGGKGQALARHRGSVPALRRVPGPHRPGHPCLCVRSGGLR